MFDIIQEIIDYDKEVLLALNGSDSLFWDNFMWIYTGKFVWFPLVVVLFYVIFKNKGLKASLFIFLCLGLIVLFADQIASSLFKPFFQRFRPTHDPEIMYLVDIVNGYRGGKYGFVSSHASNSFGILTFMVLLIRRKEFTYAMGSWAVLFCFSRIYLGVHYPGDILAGAVLGWVVGSCFYYLYKKIDSKYFFKNTLIYSDRYSRTGFLIYDVNICITALFSTFFLIILLSLVKDV